MFFLVFVLCVFFLGVVLVPARLPEGNFRKSSELENQARVLVGKIEKILEGALRVELKEGGSSDCIVVFQNLDGDAGTGGFRADEERGLERVVIRRESHNSRKLGALVYSKPGILKGRVTLTEFLDVKKGLPFELRYKFMNRKANLKEISVRVRLRKGESAFAFEKIVRLKRNPGVFFF